jgi:hypothetical protein
MEWTLHAGVCPEVVAVEVIGVAIDSLRHDDVATRHLDRIDADLADGADRLSVAALDADSIVLSDEDHLLVPVEELSTKELDDSSRAVIPIDIGIVPVLDYIDDVWHLLWI